LKNKKYCSVIAFSFLSFSLMATSFGGAFASTALAATPEVSVEAEKSGDTNALVGGIVALGLVGMMSSHSKAAAHSSAQTTGTTSAGTAVASAATTGSTTTSTTTSTTSTASDEKKAFNLLNADRASNGLSPLKFNTKLTALGEKYAQDMINRNYFSHYNPEGQSPFDRMKQAGIGYSYAGENLAINSNVSTAETAFMNSSGHRANILNTNYTEVGIGVRYDAKGSAYVVQEFIKP